MNLGGSTQKGSIIPNSAKITETLLSELNKKVRDLNVSLCCKLSEIANPTTHTNNQHFTSTPGSEFDLFSQLSAGQQFHSVSYTVVGGTGTTAFMTIGSTTIELPVGFSASYEASGFLENNFIVGDTSTAQVIFSTIIGC